MSRSPFIALLAPLVLVAACHGAGDDAGAVGRARAAITAVPPRVHCVRVLADGDRDVVRDVDVMPGQDVSVALDDLPVGRVVFTALAYESSCATAAGTQAAWSSLPTAATILPGEVTPLSLALDQVGGADVDIHFNSDGGLDGGLTDAGAPDLGPLDSGTPDLGAPHAIYVSPSGSDSAGGDSPGAALRTIGAGIARALAATPPLPVLVAGGSYTEEVTLRDGLSLRGGYSLDFASRDPAMFPTKVTGPDARTLVADGLAGPVHVDGLTVEGPALMGGDGRSSYAVFIRSSRGIELVDSVIHGGRGAAGAPGAPGGTILCGATPAPGGVSIDCSASSGAPGNAAGDPISGGSPGSGGSSICPNACPQPGSTGVTDGTNGQQGTNGVNGAPGVAANDPFGAFGILGWTGGIGSAGARGTHGTGGGGGGSGGTKRFQACFGCPTLLGGRGGSGGRGGCAGSGGQSGGAGGGSFGLVVLASQVSLERVSASGGLGGRGGAGGSGGAGEPGEVASNSSRGPAGSQTCSILSFASGAGGFGANGGSGGAGGGGPGGLGGPSIALARSADSTVVTQALTLTPGQGGDGGPGGAFPGSVGPAGLPGAATPDHTY